MNKALVSTVSANLFRPIRTASTTEPGFDPDEDVPRPEPSWPHMKIVYEIFRRFVVSSDIPSGDLRTYIGTDFIRSLLKLFSSDDFRERDILKIVVHRIYGKIMSVRSLIRRIIQHQFYLFTYESHHHNGIAELLEIMGSIINGFAVPLKREHITFLLKSLMPLHTSEWLRLYHVQLTFCITQFIEKDFHLAPRVITAMLKMWPVTHSRKQVMFLEELEAVLEITRPDLFEKVIKQLWTRLAQCIESPHFLIAERALLLWKSDYIAHLIHLYKDKIVPLVYGSLKKSSEGHWNAHVLILSTQIRQLLWAMDAELCARCENDYNRASLKENEQTLKREQAWECAHRLSIAGTEKASSSKAPTAQLDTSKKSTSCEKEKGEGPS